MFLVCLTLGALLLPSASAHWGIGLAIDSNAGTGNASIGVTGDPAFEFVCQEPEPQTVCTRFDSDAIGSTDTPVASAGSATFEITGWLYKAGDSADVVGFTYRATGASFQINVKSGQNQDHAVLPPGEGFWLDPACSGDVAPGSTVACSPSNTRAISHIDVCAVTVGGGGECSSPQAAVILVENSGSLPLRVTARTAGILEGPICDADTLRFAVVPVDPSGAASGPPLYDGSACATDDSFLAFSQLDPGDSRNLLLSMALGPSGSLLAGTDTAFELTFDGSQWNLIDGWSSPASLGVGVRIDSPSLPSGVASPALLFGGTELPDTSWSPIDLGLVPPFQHEVEGTTITFERFVRDGSDRLIGFVFQVTGDPLHLAVWRNGQAWADIRPGDGSIQTWLEPHGLGSPATTPIDRIAFGPMDPTPPQPEEEGTEEPPPTDSEEASDDESAHSGTNPPEDPPAPTDPEAEAGESADSDSTPPEDSTDDSAQEQGPEEDEPETAPPDPLPDPPQQLWIDGSVWIDDGDGVLTEADLPAIGLGLRLTGPTGDPAITFTDEHGYFSFLELEPLSYVVEFEAPAGFDAPIPIEIALDADGSVTLPPLLLLIQASGGETDDG